MKQTLCRLRKPREPVVCDRKSDETLETYDDVVDDYIRHYRDPAQDERQSFKDRSFREAIHYAGRCMRSDDKRHRHHQRRSQVTLIEVESVSTRIAFTCIPAPKRAQKPSSESRAGRRSIAPNFPRLSSG